MSAIGQPLRAVLVKSDERAALLLDEASSPVYLRFAFVERETERHVLPETVLDDWGHERSTLELYQWVRENGNLFPRAELFAFDLTGGRTQHFLRELDLMVGYACYTYPDKSAALQDGVLVEAILLPDETIAAPCRVRQPAEIKGPLRHADVSWWRVNPVGLAPFDFD